MELCSAHNDQNSSPAGANAIPSKLASDHGRLCHIFGPHHADSVADVAASALINVEERHHVLGAYARFSVAAASVIIAALWFMRGEQKALAYCLA